MKAYSFRRWVFMVSLLFPLFLTAQNDSVSGKYILDEAVVTSFRQERWKETSIHLEPLALKKIEQEGIFNLSDALSKVPGISQLSTGLAISKPVIRGLYGSRILILLSGLRFDNQQWQDEHGLGLSEIGIARVEVIKGPLSVLYGTDAVGGVINIVEESRPDSGMYHADAGVKFHTNTLGGTVQAGYKVNRGAKWFNIRLAAENNADYSDGNNTRVLNSRFNGYYAKLAYGFKHKRLTSENFYNFSLNNYGFIFSDITQFFDPDARWSRSMVGPHHIVTLNILTSKNTLELRNSRLEINGGIQSNLRMENEGGGKISLNMHLLTGQYALRWNKALSERTNLVISHNLSLENNTNYGSRKIIPDAWMVEASVAAYLKHHIGWLTLEYGAGAGNRYIKTLLTPTVNTADKNIDPFSISRPFGNGMLGIALNPDKHWNIKVNASTGVRTPNLAELSSNGLHEGIFTYEVGDPNMTVEQNLMADLSIAYGSKWFSLGASVFHNRFWNYIYLDPTTEDWFGFPVYRFRQQGARLYGGELTAAFTPQWVKGLEISASYEGLVAKTDDGNRLPFIASQKVKPQVRYDITGPKNGMKGYVFTNADVVMAQNHPAPEETATAAYTLWNAGAGITLGPSSMPIEINVAANNLLNKAYYDHLSRFKSLGLLNIGRNITISIKINFIKPLKLKNQ
jgi:iron complex outermembrane receptor protein